MQKFGSPESRIDGASKVTGRAMYAADFHLPHMLYAVGIRCHVPHGKIIRIADEEALRSNGVVAVYTHLNAFEELGWTVTEELTRASAEGLGLSAFKQSESVVGYRPLTTDVIRFAGQWIAVLVARTIHDANRGASLVQFEVESYDHNVSLNQADIEGSKPVCFFGEQMQVERGLRGTADATDIVISQIYKTPVQLHQPIEPSATVAVYEDTQLTLFDSTQAVVATRDHVALSLGLPKERVRVVTHFVGGGFGSKNQVWPHQALAAHISRSLGRPVSLQLTRNDMAVASGYRSQTKQKVEIVADRYGKLKSLRHLSHVATSTAGGYFEPCGLSTLALYPSPHLEVGHFVHRKHVSTPTPFRAPGETPGSFAVESALDEVAHRLRINPLELRKLNYPSRNTYQDREWSSIHLDKCYTIGAEEFGWPSSYVEPRSFRDGREAVGYGMATTCYPADVLPASVTVKLTHSGHAVVETAAADIGTGMYTILAQTVADQLSIPFDLIDVRLGESVFPPSPSAGRSRSTSSVLPATKNACEKIRRKLNAKHNTWTTGSGEEWAIVETGTYSGTANADNLSFYSFGAHFVEVGVDEEFAKVRVRRFTSVLDCGRIVNPKTAASQIRGSIIFGIGMALMEDAQFDREGGRLVNDNLADYHVPVNADIPEIDIHFINEPDFHFNTLGVRGLGEIGLPGTAAAIANALYSATGRRIRSLPISYSSLLAADSTVKPR
ncbi:xanthine dehydrogenase family protein molybdopterin-binding subunit [Pelagibacterium sediminicola]|uniref:xanthine dehydrogenase family protein molybdopterin-binding subunit n=1 Tax=Pelagibacterium sediminicola TaxID=2248761 RepID=UPI000E31D470|nr:xanthine dehydrogenase family protein molybdopterin-binding subunit [Pelagibacterium sediminicola]